MARIIVLFAIIALPVALLNSLVSSNTKPVGKKKRTFPANTADHTIFENSKLSTI
jgi:hypothetical protein